MTAKYAKREGYNAWKVWDSGKRSQAGLLLYEFFDIADKMNSCSSHGVKAEFTADIDQLHFLTF